MIMEAGQEFGCCGRAAGPPGRLLWRSHGAHGASPFPELSWGYTREL